MESIREDDNDETAQGNGEVLNLKEVRRVFAKVTGMGFLFISRDEERAFI